MRPVCSVNYPPGLYPPASYPTPPEQEAQIFLKTLQIIFNSFGINACAKLFAVKSSRMVRFGL
jgi:hypothetical protein